MLFSSGYLSYLNKRSFYKLIFKKKNEKKFTIMGFKLISIVNNNKNEMKIIERYKSYIKLY